MVCLISCNLHLLRCHCCSFHSWAATDLCSVPLDCLAGALYINSVIQYVAFCDCLLPLSITFSRALHAVTGVRTPLPSLAEKYVTLWIHHVSRTHY